MVRRQHSSVATKVWRRQNPSKLKRRQTLGYGKVREDLVRLNWTRNSEDDRILQNITQSKIRGNTGNKITQLLQLSWSTQIQ